MNCKQGELAVIIRSAVGNIGKIVTVIKPLGVEPIWSGSHWRLGPNKGQFCWLVAAEGGPLNAIGRSCQYEEMPIADSALRPIRDNPGEDESFRWAPSPTQKELA